MKCLGRGARGDRGARVVEICPLAPVGRRKKPRRVPPQEPQAHRWRDLRVLDALRVGSHRARPKAAGRRHPWQARRRRHPGRMEPNQGPPGWAPARTAPAPPPPRDPEVQPPPGTWEPADLSRIEVGRVREFGSVFLGMAPWRALEMWRRGKGLGTGERMRVEAVGTIRSVDGNRPADPSCVGAGCSGRMGG